MAKRAPARRFRKAKPGTKGLDPAQCRLEQAEGSAAEAAEAVEKAGGCVVGQYKEPLGGHPTLLSILPFDKVEPTPFQRDLSDTHHKRLADVISKTGYFLDPLIAVLAPGGGFWTPNVDEDGSRPESGFAFYLDQAALVTLGVCYERVTRFGGGAYYPILRRLEDFSDESLRSALKQHEKRATMVLDRGKGRRRSQEVERARTGESVFAIVCGGAHQPVAMDQGRTSAARRCSENNARTRGEVQCRED